MKQFGDVAMKLIKLINCVKITSLDSTSRRLLIVAAALICSSNSSEAVKGRPCPEPLLDLSLDELVAFPRPPLANRLAEAAVVDGKERNHGICTCSTPPRVSGYQVLSDLAQLHLARHNINLLLFGRW